MRPVVFIVPRGSPDAVYDARKRDAEALRARFLNCNDGVAFARALPDVAVRDQVSKFSADLAQQLRGILDSTAVGHLTPPEQTAGRTPDVCGLRQERDEIRHAGNARNSRSNAATKIWRAGKAVSGKFATAGDDRIQDAGKQISDRSKLVQPLALTLGEPAGIGPDLALAVWSRRAELEIPQFYLVADPDFLRRRASRLGLARACCGRYTGLGRCGIFLRPAGSRARRCDQRRARPPGPIERTSGHRLYSARGRRRHRRPSGRHRHQSGREERAVPFGIRGARSHRIPGNAGARSHQKNPASGDDVVVAGTRRRTGDHSPAAQGNFSASFDRARGRNRTHRGARPCRAVSDSAPAPRSRGDQSARRRERLARRGRPRDRRPRGRAARRRRH